MSVGKKGIFSAEKSTFFTERFWVDFDTRSGLKEWAEEYLVIPQPSASNPPVVLLAKPACNMARTWEMFG